MNENEYVLPFGIDTKGIFNNLEKIEQGVDNMTANVVSSVKEVSAAFDASSKGADTLVTKFAKGGEAAKKMRADAVDLGKSIQEALSGGKTGDLEARVKKFNDLLKQSSAKGVDIKFNIDDKKLGLLQTKINEAGQEMETFNRIIAAGKDLLGSLNPDTQAFQSLNEQIQIAEGFLEGLKLAAQEVKPALDNITDPPPQPLKPVPDNVIPAVKSLKTQLRELKEELAQMEARGEDGSAKFDEMAIKAGKLEDQIGDTAARIRVLASDTKYLDAGIQAFTAIAGAVAAGQGAIALFGEENEDAAEAIKKITGVLAILQGVQAVANALNKDSALSILLKGKATQEDTAATLENIAATEASTAANAASAAANAAVETAVAATAAAAKETTEATETAASAATIYSGAQTLVEKNTNRATTALQRLWAAMLANPITAVLVITLALIVAIYAFAKASNDAEDAAADLNDELERQNLLLNLDRNDLKRRTDLLISEAKRRGASEKELADIKAENLQKDLTLTENHLKDINRIYDAAGQNTSFDPEEYKKLGAAQIQAEQDVKDARNKIQVQANEDVADANKRAKAEAAKALADAKQNAEERKRIEEQTLKYRQELQSAQVDAMKEGVDKEIAQLRLATKQRIEQLNADAILSKEAGEQRKKLILQLETNLGFEIMRLRAQFIKEVGELEYDAGIQLNNYRAESAQRDLNILRLQYQQEYVEIERNEKLKGKLKSDLIDALDANYERRKIEIKTQYAAAALDRDEQASIDSIDLMHIYAGKSEAAVRAKELKILEIQLNFARLRLSALEDSGKDENDAEVIAAKKTIANLNKAFEDESKKGKSNIDLFSLLGLDEVFSEEEQKKIGEAMQIIVDSAIKIMESTIKSYQSNIDAIKERMAAEDEEIDELEQRIEKEKSIREKGQANYVSGLERELAEKKKKRAEDAKNLEEYQKRMEKTQKNIATIQGIIAGINLISAASKIFDDYAEIPYVGIALGVAAVAAMIAAFAVSSGNIQATTSASSTFGDGGFIDGKPHTMGGQKYRSIDGRGRVIELEGGEHVTKREMSEKYGHVLEAMNNDFKGVSTERLADMFADLGIDFKNDAPKRSMRILSSIERADAKAQQGDGSLQKIGENVDYLASRKRTDALVWEDSEFYYRKVGSTTTKKRKVK